MAPGRLYVVRNEVDDDCAYHADALAEWFPDGIEVDATAGESVDLDAAAGVVLGGSTAGVYEAPERPWIEAEASLVRDLVSREIPTLGVCFGHQIANWALGGTVEAVGTTAGLVTADLDDDPLFEGVSPRVVSLHGDEVTTLGDGMTVIGSAPHCPTFATRHRRAPLWTVQFHPEISRDQRDRLVQDFDWDAPAEAFDAVTPGRVLENFRRIVAERSAVVDGPQ